MSYRIILYSSDRYFGKLQNMLNTPWQITKYVLISLANNEFWDKLQNMICSPEQSVSNAWRKGIEYVKSTLANCDHYCVTSYIICYTLLDKFTWQSRWFLFMCPLVPWGITSLDHLSYSHHRIRIWLQICHICLSIRFVL